MFDIYILNILMYILIQLRFMDNNSYFGNEII